VFDFDGTLVESNAIKRDAYYEVFEDQGGARETLDRVLRAHPEADRYGIIDETRASLFDQGETALPSAAELAAAYGRICESRVSACAAVPGALDALAALAPRYPLYVASATPEEPLRRVVQRRGWTHLFRAVLGGPASKVTNLRAVAARESLAPNAVLLVGDGAPDRRAAREFGCAFAGFGEPAQEFVAHPALSALAPLVRTLCERSKSFLEDAPTG
jgi:phosphoglycolate phosphatase-like HAD superfamily hydrolase